MELDDVLRDEEAQQCFMEFLKKEFSSENLEFWLKCQQFKAISSKKQLKKWSEQLYHKYISLQGTHSVNIDHRARKSVEEQLKKPHCNMFEMAEKQIFHLMQTDSFSRFLQSDLLPAKFRAHLKAGNSNEVPPRLSPNSSVSSRKRKRECQPGSYSNGQHTYENELVLKNAKLSNENFLARSQVASEPQFNGGPVSLESLQCQNAFFLTDPSDQCDSESLYCNAPIYSMEASPESSQRPPMLPHRRPVIDPKWFNNRFIRVLFPDCSEEFISISQKQLIRKLVDALLAKKGFNYSSYRMFSIQTNQPIDLDKDISSIVFNDARIEQRINFSMHFPEGYLINVETLPNKLAFQTVKTILEHFGITWDDIELHDEHGHSLNSSLLMEPAFDLDHANIYVNYLSSLRTYINLKDVNELNEDGIVIRSIQFAEYSRPRASKTTCSVAQAKANTLPRSFSSFVVETPHRATIRPTQRVVEEKSGGHQQHLYSNVPADTKDIDIGELSFSNEHATDDFLTDIMTSDISKLNFICTPQKKKMQRSVERPGSNVYENLATVAPGYTEHYSVPRKENTPVHKARFVIIDENEYENVIGGQNGPLYANHKAPTFAERYCDCQPSSSSGNVLKPRNQVPTATASNAQPVSRLLGRISQMPKQPVTSAKACQSPISFTKYLLLSTTSSRPSTQPTEQPVANNASTTPTARRPSNRISLTANNNFANFCITPLKSNKPDLLANTGSSGPRSRMRTLSRFHKIV